MAVCDPDAPAKPATWVDGRKVHHCRYCDYSTGHSTDVGTHETAHLGIKAFVCSRCGKAFTDNKGLRRHEQTHLRLGANVLKCKFCVSTFATVDKLDSHVTQVHHEHLLHGCRVCGEKFANKIYLKRHQRRHSDFRPYACSACGLPSLHAFNLRVHISRRHPRDSTAVVLRVSKTSAATVPPAAPVPAQVLAAKVSAPVLAANSIQGSHLDLSADSPQFDVFDPTLFVYGSLLRLLHATPEQQAQLLATEEYSHLRR